MLQNVQLSLENSIKIEKYCNIVCQNIHVFLVLNPFLNILFCFHIIKGFS